MKKLAVVTGAASGLGFEFSKLLASDGYDLILADKNLQGLIRAKSTIENSYGPTQNIRTIHIDLSKSNAPDELINQINLEAIDILINNAGFGHFGFFHSTNWEMESDMIHLQVLNLTRLTKLVVAKMVNRGQGKILNVSSMAGFQPGPLFSVYAASKAYINSFSVALSNELKGTGVSVTLLCPGQTQTNFAKSVSENSGSKLSKVPLTAEASFVAAYGYHALKKREVMAIPGTMNKITRYLSKLLPVVFTTSINRRLQEKIRE